MRSGMTLILRRNTRTLWAMHEGENIVRFYNVTGVERLPSSSNRYPVSVLRRGKNLGIVWNVVEIREVW